MTDDTDSGLALVISALFSAAFVAATLGAVAFYLIAVVTP